MEDLPDDPTENPHMRVARFRKRIAALEAANRELRAALSKSLHALCAYAPPNTCADHADLWEVLARREDKHPLEVKTRWERAL